MFDLQKLCDNLINNKNDEDNFSAFSQHSFKEFKSVVSQISELYSSSADTAKTILKNLLINMLMHQECMMLPEHMREKLGGGFACTLNLHDAFQPRLKIIDHLCQTLGTKNSQQILKKHDIQLHEKIMLFFEIEKCDAFNAMLRGFNRDKRKIPTYNEKCILGNKFLSAYGEYVWDKFTHEDFATIIHVALIADDTKLFKLIQPKCDNNWLEISNMTINLLVKSSRHTARRWTSMFEDDEKDITLIGKMNEFAALIAKAYMKEDKSEFNDLIKTSSLLLKNFFTKHEELANEQLKNEKNVKITYN